MNNQDLIAKISMKFKEKDAIILTALNNIDRAEFIPGMYRIHAYDDSAVPIGEFQTCSQPSVVVQMASKMQLKPGMKVLEVGLGSGYATALTFKLISPGGELTSVERIRKMCAFGQHNLKKYFEEEVNAGKLRILYEDAFKIISKYPPKSFDRIYLTAGVSNMNKFPLEDFVNLLKKEGVLLIPEENGSIFIYSKSLRGKPFLLEEMKNFRFVELKHGKN